MSAPHSRACGIRKHEHGTSCHSNCPTCGGKADSVEAAVKATVIEKGVDVQFRTEYPVDQELSPEFKVVRVEKSGTFTNTIDGWETSSFIVHVRRDLPNSDVEGQAR